MAEPNANGIKIGVIPNAADFKHPADRRRYLYYLQEKGIAYEYADYEKSYDVLYLAINADLDKWSAYKEKEQNAGRNVRVIFDLSDSYLSGKDGVKDMLRAVYYYVSGQASSLNFSYKNKLLKMIAHTDVLICASEEQKKFLDAYHSNVVAAKDYFGNDIKQVKDQYELVTPGQLNVFWEGFSHGNQKIFEMLREILDTVTSHKVHIHFVTDSEYCRIGTSYMCKPTYSVLQKVFEGSGVSFHMYDWNAVTFSSIATSCDMALVPIPDDPVMMRKPENKLILLWSMGIPVITTNTASYSRVMNHAKEHFTCATREEWREKISELAASKERREAYMKAAKKYLDEHNSREVLLKSWDGIFFGQPSNQNR